MNQPNCAMCLVQRTSFWFVLLQLRVVQLLQVQSCKVGFLLRSVLCLGLLVAYCI